MVKLHINRKLTKNLKTVTRKCTQGKSINFSLKKIFKVIK